MGLFKRYFKRRREEKEIENFTYPIGWNWERDFERSEGYQKALKESQILINKIAKINLNLPDEFKCYVLPKTINDKACYWRTARLTKITSSFDNYHDFNLYLDESYVEPIYQYIEFLNYAEKCNGAKMKRSAREIYELAIATHNPDTSKCIRLFGHTPEEILIALEYYEKYHVKKSYQWHECIDPTCPCHEQIKNLKNKENFKMTRHEALKKIDCGGKVEPETVLVILESLGLIKFDEPKKEDKPIHIDDIAGITFLIEPSSAIAALQRHGYQVIAPDHE